MFQISSSQKMSRLRLITLDMKDCVIRMKRPPILDYIEVARRHGLDEKHLKTDTVGKNFLETYRHMNKVHPHFGSLSHVDSKEWWKKIVHGAFKGTVPLLPLYFPHVLNTS